MKFLVFSPYYPPHTGGLESHSEEFNRELIRLGNEVTVFTPALPSSSPTEESQGGIRIIRYPAFEIVSNYPLPLFWRSQFWQQLSSLSHLSQPDIVITRTRFFFLSFIGLLFAKRHRLPLVHIEHGSDFVRLSNPLSSALAYLYDQTLGRAVLHFSTLNIAISEAVENFIKKFDSRPSPIIYRGLDFAELENAPAWKPEALTPYENRLIVCTAARLYKWKGIEKTFEALRKLPPELQEQIVFVIAGDGEDKKRLQELSQGLPVVFLGRLTRTETIGFLKQAEIYIHSSYPGGGLSTSLLEAMYCRLAVIATPHEGASEVIDPEKNGLLVNHAGIGEALTKLLNNPVLRENLALKAQETVQHKFSWQKSIEQYLHYFQKL